MRDHTSHRASVNRKVCRSESHHFFVVLITIFLHLQDEQHQKTDRTASIWKPHCIKWCEPQYFFCRLPNNFFLALNIECNWNRNESYHCWKWAAMIPQGKENALQKEVNLSCWLLFQTFSCPYSNFEQKWKSVLHCWEVILFLFPIVCSALQAQECSYLYAFPPWYFYWHTFCPARRRLVHYRGGTCALHEQCENIENTHYHMFITGGRAT